MKKVLGIIAMLTVIFIADISAQTLKGYQVLTPSETYVKFTGDADDTIKRVADSVYYLVQLQPDFTYKIYTGTVLAKVSGNDTTVNVSIWGKHFANQTYTLLADDVSGNVTTSTTQLSSNYATASGYRYIKISYRITATPKSSGVKIISSEVKFVKQ